MYITATIPVPKTNVTAIIPIHSGFIFPLLIQKFVISINTKPVAFPACAISGAAGPAPATTGRRPTITRGLVLSAI
jgi:hypothetical protein